MGKNKQAQRTKNNARVNTNCNPMTLCNNFIIITYEHIIKSVLYSAALILSKNETDV